MALSNLQFKVHHKPESVDVAPDSVGEPSEPLVEYECRGEHETQRDDAAEEEKEAGTADEGPVSPVDEFRLYVEQFKAQQQKVSWVKALVAFLLHGALPVDAFLRTDGASICGDGRIIATVYDGESQASGLLAGWRKDVVEYLKECNKCGSSKGPRPWSAGVVLRMPVVDLAEPIDLLVVDAIGPLPETDSGNRYIMVFIDHFTWWAKSFAVRRLDSVTLVEAIANGVVARHGIPSRLRSANGSNFISEVAKSFYQTLGIKKLYGAAYHPRTQGLVERFNGTLIGMLRMHVSETQSDWDVYLPRVLFAYRTVYQEALGDSPFFSLYGRDPALPLDVAFLNLDSRLLVERQLLKAQERHERRLEGQVEVRYEGGDSVWVYKIFRARRGEAQTKKFAVSWNGPCSVASMVGESSYRIEIPTHPDKLVTVNVNRLKKYRGKWTRPYMDEVQVGLEDENGSDGEGESDLPPSSFAERLTVGREDTVIAGWMLRYLKSWQNAW
ncbi:hypothetical protein PC114_g24215 [Phytophthora cactorum]|nr:hypothetical protein PC114_g24215 [Phytophthora cactorum]